VAKIGNGVLKNQCDEISALANLLKKHEKLKTYTSSSGEAESSFKFIESIDGTKTSSEGLLDFSFTASPLVSLLSESKKSSWKLQTRKQLVTKSTFNGKDFSKQTDGKPVYHQ